MSLTTQNASGTWPAPIAAKSSGATAAQRRALKHDTLAARLLVGLRNTIAEGRPEALLLHACDASKTLPTTLSHAFNTLEDRGYAAYHDDGWRITKQGQEAAEELVERGTPTPTDLPADAASLFTGTLTGRLPIPHSAPGITRLAHCLGGKLDDGSSGKAAGRAGGDDWRAFPSRQGDWLVYRDGRRIHISAANSSAREAA